MAAQRGLKQQSFIIRGIKEDSVIFQRLEKVD